MYTIVRCGPVHFGHARSWTVTHVQGGQRRTLEIIARTWVEAIRIARRLLGNITEQVAA